MSPSQGVNAAGVTWWDELCCSFLEENFSRTNCMIEEDIYNVLDDVIQEDDVVLEVRFGLQLSSAPKECYFVCPSISKHLICKN